MSDDQDWELRKMAARRTDARLGFRAHLTAYLIVNAGLVAINLATTPYHYWFYWPMIGWGIGLFAHGAAVYGWVGADREKMIEQEIARLRAQGSQRK